MNPSGSDVTFALAGIERNPYHVILGCGSPIALIKKRTVSPCIASTSVMRLVNDGL